MISRPSNASSGGRCFVGPKRLEDDTSVAEKTTAESRKNHADGRNKEDEAGDDDGDFIVY